jgi:hypothetical protein
VTLKAQMITSQPTLRSCSFNVASAGGSRCRGLNPSMTGYCYSLIEGSVEFEIVVASQDYIFECP